MAESKVIPPAWTVGLLMSVDDREVPIIHKSRDRYGVVYTRVEWVDRDTYESIVDSIERECEALYS